MPSGTVKFFNVTIGFITPDEGGRDMFVHLSAAPPGVILQEGQRVVYDVGIDRKSGRERAENVKVGGNDRQ